MKFYGDADLLKNEIQNTVLQLYTQFPASPKVGELAFVEGVVYVCVGNDTLPVWVPLTQQITAFTHLQSDPATTWNIEHNLNTQAITIQIWDDEPVGAKPMITPNEINIVDANSATITFNTAVQGRAVCISGSFDGATKLTYTTIEQTTPSDTWTLNHDLGYNPIVRVFVITATGQKEVQPTTTTHPTTNQTVVTFPTEQVGFVKLL